MLPIELFDKVFSYLDTKTILNVKLSCRLFNEICNTKQFRYSFWSKKIDEEPNSFRILRCLEKIKKEEKDKDVFLLQTLLRVNKQRFKKGKRVEISCFLFPFLEWKEVCLAMTIAKTNVVPFFLLYDFFIKTHTKEEIEEEKKRPMRVLTKVPVNYELYKCILEFNIHGIDLYRMLIRAIDNIRIVEHMAFEYPRLIGESLYEINNLNSKSFKFIFELIKTKRIECNFTSPRLVLDAIKENNKEIIEVFASSLLTCQCENCIVEALKHYNVDILRILIAHCKGKIYVPIKYTPNLEILEVLVEFGFTDFNNFRLCRFVKHEKKDCILFLKERGIINSFDEYLLNHSKGLIVKLGKTSVEFFEFFVSLFPSIEEKALISALKSRNIEVIERYKKDKYEFLKDLEDTSYFEFY